MDDSKEMAVEGERVNLSEHTGLAFHLADRYAAYLRKRGVDADGDEFVTDSWLGLHSASKAYRPALSSFSSYGGRWAWDSMNRRTDLRAVHVPFLKARNTEPDGIALRSGKSLDGMYGSELTWHDVIPDKSNPDPEDIVMVGKLRRAIDELGPRRRKIMLMRLEGYNNVEIGEEIGLSTGRVWQLGKKAEEELKERLG